MQQIKHSLVTNYSNVLSEYIFMGEQEFSEHEGMLSLGYSQKRQGFKLRLHVGIDHSRLGRSKH